MSFGKIIFHADDFGANREISAHILDCIKAGALSSVSLLLNGKDVSGSMDELTAYNESLGAEVAHSGGKDSSANGNPRIKVSIHFNLAEGHCLSDPAKVPMLVNEKGMFNISFFKLLVISLLPASLSGARRELESEIRSEIKAQLKAALPYIDEIRVDSHQHYHMIPLVLRCILEELGEMEVDFIRIPAEPLMPFLKHPSLYLTYRPINLVKNIVLNVLNILDTGLLRPYRHKSAVFFGIMLSGKMDYKRVKALMPDLLKIARAKDLPLEILSHPGGAKDGASLLDPENKGCVEFYLSGGRKIEKEMLLNFQSL